MDALRAENQRLRHEAGDAEALRRIRSDSGESRAFTRERSRRVTARISACAVTFLAWVSATRGPITAGSAPASRLARHRLIWVSSDALHVAWAVPPAML
jgi:hypothetical protein